MGLLGTLRDYHRDPFPQFPTKNQGVFVIVNRVTSRKVYIPETVSKSEVQTPGETERRQTLKHQLAENKVGRLLLEGIAPFQVEDGPKVALSLLQRPLTVAVHKNSIITSNSRIPLNPGKELRGSLTIHKLRVRKLSVELNIVCATESPGASAPDAA